MTGEPILKTPEQIQKLSYEDVARYLDDELPEQITNLVTDAESAIAVGACITEAFERITSLREFEDIDRPDFYRTRGHCALVLLQSLNPEFESVDFHNPQQLSEHLLIQFPEANRAYVNTILTRYLTESLWKAKPVGAWNESDLTLWRKHNRLMMESAYRFLTSYRESPDDELKSEAIQLYVYALNRSAIYEGYCNGRYAEQAGTLEQKYDAYRRSIELSQKVQEMIIET